MTQTPLPTLTVRDYIEEEYLPCARVFFCCVLLEGRPFAVVTGARGVHPYTWTRFGRFKDGDLDKSWQRDFPFANLVEELHDRRGFTGDHGLDEVLDEVLNVHRTQLKASPIDYRYTDVRVSLRVPAHKAVALRKDLLALALGHGATIDSSSTEGAP